MLVPETLEAHLLDPFHHQEPLFFYELKHIHVNSLSTVFENIKEMKEKNQLIHFGGILILFLLSFSFIFILLNSLDVSNSMSWRVKTSPSFAFNNVSYLIMIYYCCISGSLLIAFALWSNDVIGRRTSIDDVARINEVIPQAITLKPIVYLINVDKRSFLRKANKDISLSWWWSL